MGGSNIMQLDKMSIDIEKIGNMEIFSHNGYILGFRDKKYSDSISFFPINGIISINNINSSFMNNVK